MLRLRCLPQGFPTSFNRHVAAGLGTGILPHRCPGISLQKPSSGGWRLRGVAAAVTGLAVSKSLATEARARSVLPSPNIHEVGYITDLEGDLATFQRYLDSERAVLYRDRDGELQLRSKNAAFVFGGDLFDRGNGDLRLARELVRLKKRHPERVFLIMGNRDINKMRLTAELEADEVRRGKNAAYPAWWDANATTLTDFLEKKQLPDTRVNRLKWILQCTMGSPKAFALRREELAHLEHKAVSDISDEEVLNSFDRSVEEDGEVTSYLQNAQIGVIIGDTLFVHGAVERQALGFVPSPTLRYIRNSPEDVRGKGSRCDLPLREWIEGLNTFAADQVDTWQLSPDWQGNGERVRGGEALMAYQSRPAMALHTVVVTCYVDGHSMPARKAIDKDKFEGYQKCSDPLSPEVVKYLLEGGVRRIVVGHKPSGAAPAVLRTSGPDGLGYEVVSGDTNYASPKGPCLRGGSWCEVRISLNPSDGTSRTRLHGKLPDDSGEYDFCLPALGTPVKSDDEGDQLIGHETTEGWWVRVRLLTSDGSRRYLLSKGKGRKADYIMKDATEIEVCSVPPSLKP